uniref:(California timema) hypothetical protein n=1 Tax=Timema californicum TaxID=61474 RepID=A0A7R9P7Q7_TIMCA|nr:unnamed protein product [Timema californicum]
MAPIGLVWLSSVRNSGPANVCINTLQVTVAMKSLSEGELVGAVCMEEEECENKKSINTLVLCELIKELELSEESEPPYTDYIKSTAWDVSNTTKLDYDELYDLMMFMTEDATNIDTFSRDVELLRPLILQVGPHQVKKDIENVFDIAKIYERFNYDGFIGIADAHIYNIIIALSNYTNNDYKTTNGKIFGVIQHLAKYLEEQPVRDVFKMMLKYKFTDGLKVKKSIITSFEKFMDYEQELKVQHYNKIVRLVMNHPVSLFHYGGQELANKKYDSDEQVILAYLKHTADLEILPHDYQRVVIKFLKEVTFT